MTDTLTVRIALPLRQRGQAIVLGLTLIMVALGVAVLLYNTGQTATEKSRLVNATDAAAYSGAVWTARQLNFLAYTNRAMVANHIAVGHFVSYMSWMRYVDEVSDEVETITAWIPYVNVVTRVISKIADILKEITEGFGKVYVPASEFLNQGLHAAQVAAKISMSLPRGFLHGVMEKTAKEYGPNIRVNHLEDMASLTGAITATRIVDELTEIGRFTKRYTPRTEASRLRRLTNESLGPSKDWIQEREWDLSLPPFVRFEKKGKTDLHMSAQESDWQAEDSVDYSVFTILGWKKIETLGSGEATAKEFARNDRYRGIPGFYEVNEPRRRKDTVLHVTALATRPLKKDARLLDVMKMDTPTDRMAALARAEIRHVRPDPKFFPTKSFPSMFDALGKGEYSNVFNPFWEARLTKLSSVGFTTF